MGMRCDLRGLIAFFVVWCYGESHDVSEDGLVLWKYPANVHSSWNHDARNRRPSLYATYNSRSENLI